MVNPLYPNVPAQMQALQQNHAASAGHITGGVPAAIRAAVNEMGFTDASPLRAAQLLVFYGEQKLGKTVQAMMASPRIVYVYSNPTILMPCAYMHKQVATVRPGLLPSIGLLDPTVPWGQGGLAKRLITRRDAIEWIQTTPMGHEAARVGYAGAFYFYAEQFFPWLTAQLSPGGAWEPHFDAVAIDELSTFLTWVFDDLTALAENWQAYGNFGARFRAKTGGVNLFELYDAVLAFFKQHIVGLYERSRKHVIAVCHEQRPKVDKDGSRKAPGGPLMPSLTSVEIFLKEATLIWRCIGMEAGSIAKEQRRVEATMAMLRGAGQQAAAAAASAVASDDGTVPGNGAAASSAPGLAVSGPVAPTTPGISPQMMSGAKYSKIASEWHLPDVMTSWVDDLGWPSNMRRFIQTQFANEFVAGGRAPFTPPVIAMDVRHALAYGGLVEPLPRLKTLLTEEEFSKLQALGAMREAI